MLLRVLHALRDARRVARIQVSIDAPELLDAHAELAAWRADGRLRIHASLGSPARSVVDALAHAPAPRVLVTTADHALLTGARVDRFLDAADATGADVGVGLVERSAFDGRPERDERTWIRLRGGAYTGANLFAFRSAGAQRAAGFFARAESQRKKPWKLLAALAPGLGAAYLTGRLDLERAFAEVSRRAGARLAPVRLDDAEAAIDVDKPSDLATAEAILGRREVEAAAG
jgi:2-phospho-L-lactate guanylyltransferase (CobY/MobA/RfbA family)